MWCCGYEPTRLSQFAFSEADSLRQRFKSQQFIWKMIPGRVGMAVEKWDREKKANADPVSEQGGSWALLSWEPLRVRKLEYLSTICCLSLVEAASGEISSLELSTYPPDPERTSEARRKQVPKQTVTDAPVQMPQPLGIQVNAKRVWAGGALRASAALFQHPKRSSIHQLLLLWAERLRCHKRQEHSGCTLKKIETSKTVDDKRLLISMMAYFQAYPKNVVSY